MNVSSRLRRIAFVVCTLILLEACGAGQMTQLDPTMGVPSIDAKRSDSNVLRFISSDIPVNERSTIYDALASMPIAFREHVVLFSNGKIFANRASLKVGAFYYQPTNHVGVFSQPDGQLVTFPEEVERRAASGTACGVGGCTGVLHKVVSSSGYNDVQANATIPCSTSQLSHKYQQNGFVYLGGLSPSNSQVDIGIQINNPGAGASPDPGKPTSIQPFVNVDGVAGSLSVMHLACDQPVFMDFWPAQQSGSAKVYLSLYLAAASTGFAPGGTTLTSEIDASTGWSQVCSGCSVKRVTSIAVPAGRTQTALQTWLGVKDPFSLSPQPTEAWGDVQFGAFHDFGGDASPVMSSWSSYLVQDDPANGQASGLILVNQLDSANEWVGINESGPRLQIH